MNLRRLSPVWWLLLLPMVAHADLQPQETAILANGTSPESIDLAHYYAGKRKIPSENICVVDIPRGEVLSRDAWDRQVRPAIRAWLTASARRQPIRCIVTTWDVPLKIGKANADEAGITLQRQMLAAEKARRLDLIEALTRQFARIAPHTGTRAAREVRPASDSPRDQLAKQAFQHALTRAQERVNQLEDPQQQQLATNQLQQLVVAGSGMHALSEAMAHGIKSSPAAADQLEPRLLALQGRMQGLGEARAMIEATPMSTEHHQLSLGIIDRTNGALGAIAWIDGRLKKLKANETNASFDNELSCVLWPPYNLLLWQPNYLHHQFAGSPLRQIFPTVMVARIDAPTLELCQAMVDTALEIERSGLEGKFYLDGRGLVQPGQQSAATGSYEEYDLAIMRTARRFANDPRVEVVYQNGPALFQPGECPDAALYCGWYSVAKYVDAFDWNPGAVGFHLASFELRTLRKTDSQVWCKRMLEDGVCATIGAVQEPYLGAFPRPDQFFPLLLDGDRTLVECYYETTPYTSWAVALVGDPLYRPFKMRKKTPGMPP